MLEDLRGKRALITGSSTGIGAALAKEFARLGIKVAVHGNRNAAAAEAVAKEIVAAGGEAVVVIGDISKKGGPAQIVADAVAGLGGLDILVNNAGITRDMLFARLSDESWSDVLDVNLTAPFRLARAALRGMMRQRYGRIINITSVVAVTGNPGQGNYTAAKAGLIGMSKSLAAEVAGRNITVNCVAPGFIETAMTDVLNEKIRAAILERVPAKRLGSGDEIAAAVVFLASNEASYVTGQTLHVNGGMAMI
jgi:3-oxoacyl-[acyl-carrier protein] reductase